MENFYFAVTAVLLDGFLPQIHRRDRHVISGPMRALWSVNLMSMLNCLLLNRGCIVMKVLKALTSVVCVASM
jgi:hypothetical protein